MKKHKVVYKLGKQTRRKQTQVIAKREISYEIKLATKLMLDELCFNWNKERLEKQINASIDEGNRERFMELSKLYQAYTWE